MPSGAERIAEALAGVRRRIERAGGDPTAIEIVAVTMGRPPAICRDALAAGLAVLGENRVQEALAKMGEVEAATWHLIGPLQTNKARHAGRFGMIQSVDSVRLAEALAARGSPPVLLEVNVAREPRKHGFLPEAAPAATVEVAELLQVRGLMGMAPRDGDPRPAFGELRRIHVEAEQRLGRRLPILSMGMSDDFEVAVEEGATMLRLGRILFGSGSLAPT